MSACWRAFEFLGPSNSMLKEAALLRS